MAELEAAGGDFTRLSDAVAARDGALPVGHPPGRPPLPGAARVGAAGRRRRGRADPLRHPRPGHRGGGAAAAARARRVASARCSGSWPRRARRTCSASTSATWNCGRTTWTGPRAPARRWRGRRRRWSSSPPAGCCHRAACTARRQRASRSRKRLRHEARRRREPSAHSVLGQQWRRRLPLSPREAPSTDVRAAAGRDSLCATSSCRSRPACRLPRRHASGARPRSRRSGRRLR